MTVYVVGFNHIFSPSFAYEVMRNMTYEFTGWHEISVFYIFIALYLQLLRMQDVEKARKKRKIDWMKKM